MTTSQRRPSAARRNTRTSKAKQDAVMDQGVEITVDGKKYRVIIGDIDGLSARRFRAAVGMSFIKLAGLLDSDPDIDLIAGVIFMAGLLEGDGNADYEAILADLSYDADFDIEVVTDDEVDADPEG